MRRILCLCLLLVAAGAADGPECVAFAEVGGQVLHLDVHRPSQPRPGSRPAVVLVHGGAWSAGGREDCVEIATFLAGQGYVAFSIDYRLVTDTADRWPVQLEDTRRAVRWVRAHAVDYGVDPARIAALGGSAGGHIVLCLGTPEAGADSDGRVACVVSLAGPTDLADDFAGQVAQGAWTAEQVRRLLGVDPTAAPAGASPIRRIGPGAVPALIIQGRSDDVVPPAQAERHAKALRAAGVEAELVLFDGGHGADKPLELLRIMAAIGTFLGRHLHP